MKKLVWLIAAIASAQVRVSTDAGTLEGISFQKDAVFLGIPFASPPIGPLRWKPPQPPMKWKGVRPAKTFGAACPQSDATYNQTLFAEIAPDYPYYKDPRMDEDCLTLNVWSRNIGAPKPQPVMVWIHGGSNIGGVGSLPPFGPKLAARGVVYVSLNYRLGALGFLAAPELTAESPHHASGNYGIVDLIAGLEWVHRNIASFGGDPSNVTVFGESAGGVMICYLMSSPLAHGLFHHAILESCSCQSYISPELKRRIRYEYDQASAEDAGTALAHAMGASTVKQLRERPADEIVKVSETTPAVMNFLYAGSTVDGWVLPQQPARTFAEQQQMKVNVLTGSNADEGTVALGVLGEPTLANYRTWLQHQFDTHADEVFAAYPAKSDADVRSAFLAAMDDYQRADAVRTLARETVRAGEQAYLYYFDYPSKGAYASQGLGTFHALDLSFVAGGFFRKSRWGEPNSADWKVVETMTGYWVQFAKTGDPNHAGSHQWMPYDPANPQALELGSRVKMIPAPRIRQSEVFERILKARLNETSRK
ncbi:MAG TPA: carboxylesterase family protein [Bryobacteraceae bacterium]